MKTPKIRVQAELGSRAGASPYLKAAGDAVLIERGVPRWLLIKCPCGCGDEIPVNLDARAGKAWRIYRGLVTGLSLFPSVWRDTGCQSHFIVWRDTIFMIGTGYGRASAPRDNIDVAPLARRVLLAWPSGRQVSYVDVADTLREIPWDVQEACQALVATGDLVEAAGDRPGWYRRASK